MPQMGGEHSRPQVEGFVGNGYSESVNAVDESSFERLVNIQAYSDDELRTLAQSLAEQEAAVSKQRRLLQGELDIVRAELVRRLRDSGGAPKSLVVDGDVAVLADILAAKGSGTDTPEQ
jgi:hypothetical protein